ncbi:MAG: 4Fe-4S dicluster domain-containing protein [Thermodesulfobacteriota bacterium]
MNRRTFLKTLGLAGAGAACAPAAAASAASAPDPRPGDQATLFDLSKCVGCGACVEACREANASRFPEPEKPFPRMLPEGRVKPEDWSDRRDADDRLTPYNWLFVQHFAAEREGRSVELHMPRRCMHCTNPPCANLCPWGACAKEDDGAVVIDADLCLGGAKCRSVCPWGIPQRQTGVGLYLDLLPSLAGNGVMYKCDRCAPRRARGETPACIEACPFGVQSIGPRDEIVAKAQELAKAMNGHIYGLDENGGTNTIYVSPAPFETLAAAAPAGPGRPGLARVEDAMADSNKLAAAVLLAPVAGLAAGLRKAWRAWSGADSPRPAAEARPKKEDSHADN